MILGLQVAHMYNYMLALLCFLKKVTLDLTLIHGYYTVKEIITLISITKSSYMLLYYITEHLYPPGNILFPDVAKLSIS